MTEPEPRSVTRSMMPNWIVDRRGDTTLVVAGDRGSAEPADWPGLLERAMRRHGRSSVLVAKRIDRASTLLAMGEFVVHPKGLFSQGRGLPAQAFRFPEEVDGTLTGVALFPNQLVDGLAPPRGPLGLLSWCLEARLRGGRVIAIPEVAWVNDDAPMQIGAGELRDFVARFGFHPFAPDIDAIAARDDLAPLRWNVRHFGSPQPFEKYAERGAFHWTAFEEHPPFRQRAEFLIRLASDAMRTTKGTGPVLDIGCGDGLYAAHLAANLSRADISVIGVDDDAPAVRVACERSGDTVRFEEGSVYALAYPDAAARGALLFDVIEHLHNPARALREVARVLMPGAALIVSTPEWQFGHSSDPTYHACEFTSEELVRTLTAEGLFRVESTSRIGGVYRDVVVVARRAGD